MNIIALFREDMFVLQSWKVIFILLGTANTLAVANFEEASVTAYPCGQYSGQSPRCCRQSTSGAFF